MSARVTTYFGSRDGANLVRCGLVGVLPVFRQVIKVPVPLPPQTIVKNKAQRGRTEGSIVKRLTFSIVKVGPN